MKEDYLNLTINAIVRDIYLFIFVSFYLRLVDFKKKGTLYLAFFFLSHSALSNSLQLHGL